MRKDGQAQPGHVYSAGSEGEPTKSPWDKDDGRAHQDLSLGGEMGESRYSNNTASQMCQERAQGYTRRLNLSPRKDLQETVPELRPPK